MITEQKLINRYLEGIGESVLKRASDSGICSFDAAEITAHIDLDHENVYYAKMLAEIGTRDGFAGFRDDLIPRLKGLYRFGLVQRAYYQNAYSRLFAILREHGIDFICGYYLSLLYGYEMKSILMTSDVFDLAVRSRDHETVSGLLKHVPEQYHPAIRVKIRDCDDDYVWKHAFTVSLNETESRSELKLLNPTSMILLNGRHIWSSMKDWEMHSAVLADRMHWLYEYRIIRAYSERIDFKTLAEHAPENIYRCIRFILQYAAEFYRDEELHESLNTYMQPDNGYQIFLEQAEDRGAERQENAGG